MNQAQPKTRRLDPPAIKSELARIAALSAAEKFAEAEARARTLHAAAPQRGDVNDTLALALVDQRKLHEALPFAKAAVAAETRNTAFLVNLGRLHIELEQIEFAAPILEKAYSLDPHVYQAPWALAEFFYRTGDGERAAMYFEQALAHAAGEDRLLVLQDYSNCLAALGLVEQAESMAEELRNDPRHRAGALYRLAGLRKHGIDSPIAGELRKELDNPELPARHRSALLLALGRLYENSGHYRDAFRHFAMSRDLLRPMTSSEVAWRDVTKLIAEYTPEVFSRFREFGHPSDLPVFVVGLPRSGTTLIEQIIASHPEAGGAGELARITKMNTNLSGEGGPQGLFAKMQAVGPDRWKQVPEDYLRLLRFLAPGARRVVDKMPHNFLALGFIRLNFPNARIVWCRRHPAASFVSSYQNPLKRGHSYSYRQQDYAQHYLDYVRLMEHWKKLMPGAIHEIRYEELASNPGPVIRALISYIGLPWDDRCLTPERRKSAVKTISRMQVRQPINAAALERWKYYEPELAPLLTALGIGASSPKPSNSGPR